MLKLFNSAPGDKKPQSLQRKFSNVRLIGDIRISFYLFCCKRSGQRLCYAHPSLSEIVLFILEAELATSFDKLSTISVLLRKPRIVLFLDEFSNAIAIITNTPKRVFSDVVVMPILRKLFSSAANST